MRAASVRTTGPGRIDRERLAGWLTAAALLVAAGCGGGADGVPGSTEAEPGGFEASYMFDPSDKRNLVGFADDVFVARVVKRAGEASLPTSSPTTKMPATQYAVQVIEAIKGDLEGTVRVSQIGGRAAGTPERAGVRSVELFEGDPLLEPGELVLLATRYDQRRRWHTIVAQPHADRRIRSEAERERLVREFTEAHREKRTR